MRISETDFELTVCMITYKDFDKMSEMKLVYTSEFTFVASIILKHILKSSQNNAVSQNSAAI